MFDKKLLHVHMYAYAQKYKQGSKSTLYEAFTRRKYHSKMKQLTNKNNIVKLMMIDILIFEYRE